MAMLNIPSSVEDPCYRYKMPRIISNKECRGKGSKTSIMNIGDVAHAIQRHPIYLTKFFGYELGAQTSYTNKKGEGERAVVNGHHDTQIFQKLVDDFVEKYVLCMRCHLPEIDMVVNKKGLVAATCKACNWKGELDNRHKLATYISKNPPSSGIGFNERKKDEKSKEDRQRVRAAKQKTEEDVLNDDANSDQSDKNKEHKENKPKKESQDDDKDGVENEITETKAKSERKLKKETTGDQDEDEDQYEDGEAKEKKEKKDQKDQKEKRDRKKQTDTYSASDEKESDEKEDEEEDLRYDGRIMSEVVKDLVEFVENSSTLTVDTMYEEVRAQQVTRGFDNKLRMYVVISAFFPSGTLSANGIKLRSKFIQEFITNGRLPFAEWIWGFEAYLSANPSATKAWAMSLKALYDADVAEEEQILEYYEGQHNSPGFDASKKAAAPFITWLETSEDGSDEGGGDEDSD